MFSKSTSQKWLPERVDQFHEFVSMTNTSDLNFLNQMINLANMNQENRNILQKFIIREFVIRRYFTFPPSYALIEYINDYDSNNHLESYKAEFKELNKKDLTDNEIKEFKELRKKDKADLMLKLTELNKELNDLGLDILK